MKYEFQANTFFKVEVCPMPYLGYTYTKTLFIIHQKFKCKRAPCVPSGNPD